MRGQLQRPVGRYALVVEQVHVDTRTGRGERGQVYLAGLAGDVVQRQDGLPASGAALEREDGGVGGKHPLGGVRMEGGLATPSCQQTGVTGKDAARPRKGIRQATLEL